MGRVINAQAELETTLQFKQYENVKPRYVAGWTEVVPDEWTDEQVRQRRNELLAQAREDIENLIDIDIEDVKEFRFYEFLRMKKEDLKRFLKDS